MHRPLILIVDDESKIRRLLAQNLELEGFDVQTASDVLRHWRFTTSRLRNPI